MFGYRDYSQEAEMINAANVVLSDDAWKTDFPSEIELGSGLPPAVLQSVGRPRGNGLPVLIWYWYEVNGQATTNTLEAKFREAKNFLTFRPNNSTAIILTLPISESIDASQAVMRDFLGSFYSILHACSPATDEFGCEPIERQGDS
jgi:EpsI family protein